MEELEKYRKEIDQYDKELVEIFEKRMETVLKIISYKKNHGLPIFNQNREEEVLEKAVGSLHNKNYKEEVEGLYKEMMRSSRKFQSKYLFPYNIVLVGFLGSGKSSVGKALSQLLEMSVLDSDILIENRAGISVRQIFEEYGEKHFRQLEREIITEISHGKNTIISCGGGVVLNDENIENLKKQGRIIFLQAEKETIYDRLLGDESRPLLQNNWGEDTIEKLLMERLPYYEKAAHLIVHTDGKATDEIAKEIVAKLLDEEIA